MGKNLPVKDVKDEPGRIDLGTQTLEAAEAEAR
jgi:hypothetical protein